MIFTSLTSDIYIVTSTFFTVYLIKRYRFVQRLNKLPGRTQLIGLLGEKNAINSMSRFKRSLGAGIYDLITKRSLEFSNDEDGNECGIWTMWIASHPILMTNNPHLIEQITGRNGLRRKGRGYGPLRELVGRGLLTGNGDSWQEHRNLIKGSFNPQILGSFIPSVIEKAENLVEKLKTTAARDEGRIEDIRQYILGCSLEILLSTQMGTDHPESEAIDKYIHNIRLVTKTLVERLFSPYTAMNWIFKLLKPAEHEKYTRCLEEAKLFTKQVIEQFISNKSTGDIDTAHADKQDSRKEYLPLLKSLVTQHFQSEKTFTMNEIEEEMNTFMVAGHDTTAWTLIWSMILLASHPEWQDPIKEEGDALFRLVEEQKRTMTISDLQELRTTDAVLKETLRLYPTAPFITRANDSGLVFGKYEIPAGIDIAIPIWTVHQNGNHWNEPTEFLPNRFLDDQLPRHKCAYIPFSIGERDCIGKKYAMLESQLVLVSVVRRFIISGIIEPETISPAYGIINKSFDKGPLRFTER